MQWDGWEWELARRQSREWRRITNPTISHPTNLSSYQHLTLDITISHNLKIARHYKYFLTPASLFQIQHHQSHHFSSNQSVFLPTPHPWYHNLTQSQNSETLQIFLNPSLIISNSASPISPFLIQPICLPTNTSPLISQSRTFTVSTVLRASPPI